MRTWLHRIRPHLQRALPLSSYRHICRGATRPLALLGAVALVGRQHPLGITAPPIMCLSTSAADRKVVLVQNGKASAPWIEKGKLLKDYTGAYTTARTVDQTSIFELDMHCRRLHETATAILHRQLAGAAEPAGASTMKAASSFLERVGVEGLKPLVRREMSTALQYLGASESASEYQVTMLLTWDTVGAHTPDGRGFDLFTFVQPMPSIDPMVDVEAHRATRNNPTIKDVQWVNDRQYLEELQKKAGVNEVVMFDADGSVSEGLQTNFFAVSADGVLLTAPDERVLAGTVRKVVLEVAKRNGIPVRMECPSINALSSWDSCFICSTSRLVKPIRHLRAPEFSADRSFPAEQSIAHRLEALVRNSVRSNSESLAP
mmetsp:Transcript_108110/g.207792  ORF Transcript_108110/g.207792 Transcript_108110/m.207792 type:complete len:375 (-) Transcript_108110:73-1197(-)